MTLISTKLFQQRIRNRIIEYFDVSFEEITKWGTDEIINMWEDIVPNGWDEGFFCEPVFSQKEQTHIKRFCLIWERAAEATSENIFNINTLKGSLDWSEFVHEAQTALKLFEERGKLPEEVEQS